LLLAGLNKVRKRCIYKLNARKVKIFISQVGNVNVNIRKNLVKRRVMDWEASPGSILYID